MDRRRRAEEANKPKKVYKDPFLRRKVTCPICEHAVEQRGLKTNLYRAEHKDLDLRPYSYKWQQENLSKYHPPFYYVWYCPKCYFASGRQFYEDPLKGCFLSMRKFKKTILEGYKGNPKIKKVVNRLTTNIDLNAFTYEQAIKLHLLACFWLEQFKDFRERDAMNLARLYIRTAWLFRDLSEDEEAAAMEEPLIKQALADVKEHWEKCIQTEEEALRRAAHYYEVTLAASEIIENAVDELNVLLVVAKVHMKLKNIKEALDALTAAVTSGTRAKLEVDNELRTPVREEDMTPIMAKKRKGLQQESADLRGLIDRSRTLLDKVKAEWFEMQTAKAKDLIAKNKGKGRTQLRQLLFDEKIEQRIVNRLVPEEQEKKKGFFASLFGGK